MSAPKLFVSYSWTSPDHEAWVLQLCTDLRENAVDVILDKWDLREGHDAHAFMEKMVTDPDIHKVILICDKAYVDKTDGRTGGVGTEAQIISGKIYEAQTQDKFVAIVREHDEGGKPYLPAYYRSRIYIDLSDPARQAENFERLLRWVYDKPVEKKPELGPQPTFLTDNPEALALATSSRWRRAVDAIRNNRDHALPAATEYLTLLADEFEKLRLDANSDPFDDAVVASIQSFLPYRNQAIELFLNLALYCDTLDTRRAMHRFFERLVPYLDRPQLVNSYREWDFDNFRFIIHELFLYALVSLIEHERFETAAHLMVNDYYVPGRSEYGRDTMVRFGVFRQYMKSLVYRNERLSLRRLSGRADLLMERCKVNPLQFRQLMEVDFILFLRDNLDGPDNFRPWWPETLVYAERQSGPFAIFARSRSSSYFSRAKVLLGIESKEQLKPLLADFASGRRALPRWEYASFSPTHLLGFDELATRP